MQTIPRLPRALRRQRRLAPLDPAEARRRMIRRYHGVRPTRGLVGQRLQIILSMPVSSSWVKSIHLVRIGGSESVMLIFNDGARCHYPGTTVEDFELIRRASSKGKAVWRHFYRKPYVLR